MSDRILDSNGVLAYMYATDFMDAYDNGVVDKHLKNLAYAASKELLTFALMKGDDNA